MSQERSQPLGEGVRDRVFQALRLFVHLFPGVVEALQEEGLDQAVAPEQPQGLHAPGFGERSSLVALVLGEAHFPQSTNMLDTEAEAIESRSATSLVEAVPSPESSHITFR